MKTRHHELPFSKSDALTLELFSETSIFFDIETTGFSPTHTQLYLIGCARRKGSVICLDQFFAETPAEEKLILTAFLELIRAYDTIITYNGIGFDIPYLKAKCDRFHLTEFFSDFEYVDIFKSISKLKHIFKLENYKQKTIENYLKIYRKDMYNGKELIPIYQSYVKSPTEDALQLLFLHNYEDVLGMLDLMPILSYPHLFCGKFKEITNVEIHQSRTYDKTQATELVITLKPEFELPRHISYRMDDIYLSGGHTKISLAIRLTEEELKYFYPNYKDYYYLPNEDTAIHKSVSAYVDKEHREPAKASTCYTKKAGQFLPQYNSSFITPAFFKEYGDKIAYFAYSRSFHEDYAMITEYTRHILLMLAKGMHKHIDV